MRPHKRAYLAILSVAFLASCMLGPINRSEVASRSSTVDFYGLTSEGGQEIVIQARASSGDDWSNIATATSNSTPFLRKFDTDLFQWEVAATIYNHLWEPGAEGYRTQVRARRVPSSGASTNLLTFDSEQDGTRRCLESTDDWGEFIERCGSPESPVVTIETTNFTSRVDEYNDSFGSIREETGGTLRSLPSLPEPAIAFTSFPRYDVHWSKDDDFSVSIELKDEKDELEVEAAWKNGRGFAEILVHQVALPDGVRVHYRELLTSDQMRDDGLPWAESWPMDGEDRCVVIVELRKTWGLDDDASYRFKTNNITGGREICTLNADLGHGNRDFTFVVTVLAWNPEETDFDVTVNQISTSKSVQETELSDLPETDVRIMNPVVDWGSDDDVTYFVYLSPPRGSRFGVPTGVATSRFVLSRSNGFREIKFELIGLSIYPEDM